MRVATTFAAAVVATMFFATSALGVGADLSVVACPGNPGASADAGLLDCAGGQTLTLLVTFMPAENYPDLAGIDGVLSIAVSGDLGTTATFWDFGGADPAALGTSHARPAT